MKKDLQKIREILEFWSSFVTIWIVLYFIFGLISLLILAFVK